MATSNEEVTEAALRSPAHGSDPVRGRRDVEEAPHAIRERAGALHPDEGRRSDALM
jgi:hypothetical protein